MLTLLHRAARFSSVARPCLRAQPSAVACRSISTTPARWSTAAPEPPTPEEEAELEAATPEPIAEEEFAETPEEDEAKEEPETRVWQPTSYNEFLSTVGAKYKFAKPANWLGGDVVRVVSDYSDTT